MAIRKKRFREELEMKIGQNSSSSNSNNSSSSSRSSATTPSRELSTEESKNLGMVGIFSAIPTRKMASGNSSGSSEITPLLNGSQEGPCYAFSSANRDGDMMNSTSSLHSADDANEVKPKYQKILTNVKLVVLSVVLLFCVFSLTVIKEHYEEWNSIALRRGSPISMNVTTDVVFKQETVLLRAKGPFLPGQYYSLSQDSANFELYKITVNGTYEPISKIWRLLLEPDTREYEGGSKVLEHIFELDESEKSDTKTYQLRISTTKRKDYVPMSIDLSVRPNLPLGHIMMALIVLIGLYVLIIFEIVHRTLAAMIGATTAISCLAIIGQRPSLMEVMSWVDVETLSLLFGMMVLVSILCETGFFDYIAILTYKVARGQIWPLITGLCAVTAILSAFLDNVTTVLLMSAIAIRLCETMNIDPKHMLISLVVFSNIGGAMTPVGDPPNVIIVSNKRIMKAGIGFGNFTLHMVPAVLLCLVASYVLLRIIYRDISTLRFSDPPEVVEVKHEIEVWKKAFNSLAGYSRDEDTVRAILHRKITILETLLRKKLYDSKISDDDYKANLKELSNTFKVKNSSLLLKSGITIGVVILFFFLQSIPGLNLSIGWIAILGAIFLLTLGNFNELESVLSRVEWTTLLFFAALFVVMEALARLDLVRYIVNMTQDAISGVGPSHRLLVAIVIVLWISALSSSIIDNIPFTTVMVQVVTDLAANEEMQLPLKPLVFALALGACFGGNGTLIGASANVVTAGLSEQHGYRFSFCDFFKVGFPVMILTTTISTGYLIVCHVLLEWND